MRFGYFLFWCVFRSIFRILFGCRIYHADRVPLHGPALLAANHASFMDPPLIGASLNRETHYLARNTLFRFPIFRNILYYINVIPVDRGGKSPKGLRTVANSLKDGNSVILFPEGTRSHDGNLQTAKSGVGLLAIRSEAPVIPIRVFGTFESYGRHLKWPKPGRVQVKMGHPMWLKELREEARTANKERTKQIYQEAADQIMAAIAGLTPNFDCQKFGN
jgi:1-acyl-sn-glycerol-3-phosphate acyltransferase